MKNIDSSRTFIKYSIGVVIWLIALVLGVIIESQILIKISHVVYILIILVMIFIPLVLTYKFPYIKQALKKLKKIGNFRSIEEIINSDDWKSFNNKPWPLFHSKIEKKKQKVDEFAKTIWWWKGIKNQRPIIWSNLRLKPFLHWIDATTFDFLKICKSNGFNIYIFVNDSEPNLKVYEEFYKKFRKIIDKYFHEKDVTLMFAKDFFSKNKNTRLLLDYLYGTILPSGTEPIRSIDLDIINLVLSLLAAYALKKEKNIPIFHIVSDTGLAKLKDYPLLKVLEKEDDFIIIKCNRLKTQRGLINTRDENGLRLDVSIEELKARLYATSTSDEELMLFYKLFLSRETSMNSIQRIYEKEGRDKFTEGIIEKIKVDSRYIGRKFT